MFTLSKTVCRCKMSFCANRQQSKQKAVMYKSHRLTLQKNTHTHTSHSVAGFSLSGTTCSLPCLYKDEINTSDSLAFTFSLVPERLCVTEKKSMTHLHCTVYRNCVNSVGQCARQSTATHNPNHWAELWARCVCVWDYSMLNRWILMTPNLFI